MNLHPILLLRAARWLRAVALLATVVPASAQSPLPPSPLPGLAYEVPFFPGARYDAAVPTPDSILGFAVGSKPATPAQIERICRALADKSPRVRMFQYGATHEGRPLHYLVIASPANLGRLDALKADLAKIADPRAVSAAEGDRLAATLPAVAWMAYSIHGDELSAGDAAVAVAHHLAAATGDDVNSLLENVVVIIDPLMNPDGRERCLTVVAQNRTVQPSVDDQSILHTDAWPSGRTNHYLFDMNRDWLWATQPETRGRIRAVSEWRPHYFMEGHEMGAQSTFLFMPAREPVNPNLPASAKAWEERFARDQAAAFDAKGWRYFTGEWNENWYPGYSGSWAALRGAIGNLYEQAGIVTDAVRRPEGTLESYRESVHKQLVSTMANLTTLARHRREILRDFLAEKRACVAAATPQAMRTYALPPTGNHTRWRAFLELLQLQGFEVFQAAGSFKGSGVDRLGLEVQDREFPAGTLLVPGRQPEARLLAAMLEFDPRMTPEFLNDERRELLRFNKSKLYDTTGWSAPMLFDLECVTLAGELPAAAAARRLEAGPAPAGGVEKAQTTVGFALDGADDASVVAAGRLMERDVWVRVANKALVLDGREFARGSVVITRKDNARFPGDLAAVVGEVARSVGTRAIGLDSGLGPGDRPDLGGEHFVLLHPPRIAVMGREPFRANSYGECWYAIDHVLGLRASYLDFNLIGGADLRRYNAIVLPESGRDVLKDRLEALRSWVQAGGTLIAMGSSAGAVAKDPGGIGSIRLLPAILAKPEPFYQAVIREWEGRTTAVEPEKVWAFTAPAGDNAPKIPWLGASPARAKGEDKPGEDELKRRDDWRKIFMPQGVVIAGRVDDRSWLTAGCGDYVPVLYRGDNVLVVPPGVQAPVRAGYFTVAPPAPPKSAKPVEESAKDRKDDAKKEETKPPPGWTIAPPGYELRLRMSGLLWPEAAERIANSACVARESVGAGQIVLFATAPNFRAATLGTMRIFHNAVVYGPGMGASQPIKP